MTATRVAPPPNVPPGRALLIVNEHSRDGNAIGTQAIEALILPSLRSGRHGRWAEVKTLAGQEVTVETRRPRSVNADGEIVTRTPAHFRVRPGAVNIYAPLLCDGGVTVRRAIIAPLTQ